MGTSLCTVVQYAGHAAHSPSHSGFLKSGLSTKAVGVVKIIDAKGNGDFSIITVKMKYSTKIKRYIPYMYTILFKYTHIHGILISYVLDYFGLGINLSLLIMCTF